jgi:hypothetical protein
VNAASCKKGLKHEDMRVSINTVLKDICRAGNAICMKRSMEDDQNGSYSVFELSQLFELNYGIRNRPHCHKQCLQYARVCMFQCVM